MMRWQCSLIVHSFVGYDVKYYDALNPSLNNECVISKGLS